MKMKLSSPSVLLSTCVFTGLALLGANNYAFAAEAPPTPKIAAYNAFFLPSSLFPNWGQSERADMISNDGVVSGNDVVILQELFDNKAGNKLLSNLSREYPNQTGVIGRSRSGWDDTQGSFGDTTAEDGGVALVSKWPITNKVQHIYSQGCGADNHSNKGFAYARFDSPEGPVNVIGTHLQAADAGCSDGTGASVRKSQIGEINEFVAKNVAKGEALYIGGDLNFVAGSDEANQGLKALNAVTPTFRGPASWNVDSNSINTEYQGKHDSERLDYVLPVKGYNVPDTFTNTTRDVHSKPWTVSKLGTDYTYTDYSDHYPVTGY